MKKRILPSICVVGAVLAGPALAASKATTVALRCDTVRLSDKQKVELSVLLNEAERTMTVGGQVIREAMFDQFKVSGTTTRSDPRIPGVSRETIASLDRITGKFSLMTLPVASNGGEFSEEQKELIVSTPMDPSFLGPCTIAKPLF